MGAVLLALLYLGTSLLLGLAVRALARPPSIAAWLVLTLLPLVYTGGGFLPRRVVAPTAALAGVPPWASPPLMEEMTAGSSPKNPLLLDPMTQMEPWRRAARDDLLLNPAQGAGAALLGNAQSAALFPLEVAARVLVPVRATTYLQAARVLLAVWGMFLLGRGLALSDRAALLAAVAYSGAGFLQLWRAHPHSYVAAVAPWILYGILLLVRHPGPRPAVLLAGAGAVGVAAGHPETLLQVVVLGLLLVAGLALVGRRRQPLRATGWGLASGVLAALLAAPVLLPVTETLLASAEWQHRRERPPQRVEIPLPRSWVRLVPAVDHLGLGDPQRDDWSGPENLAEVGGASLGAAVLVLVPAAFAAGRGRRRQALVWLAVGVLGLLVSAHIPWISKPFGWVPLLRSSLLKRLSLWWALAGAVLAGMAVDALLRGRGRRHVVAGAAGLAALLAAVAAALPGAREPLGLALEVGGLAVGCAAALTLAGAGRARGEGRWRGRSLVAGAALALLAGAVLVPRAVLFSRWIPVSSALSFYPEVEALRFVRERAAGWRVAGLDAALVPHTAAFFGLEEVRCYDPMTFAPYETFARALGEKGRIGWQRVLNPNRPALAFLGVRYVFAHPSQGELPGVERVYAGPDAAVFENPRALPRIFVPRRYRVAADADEALAEAVEIPDFSALATAWGPDLPPPGAYSNPRARIRDLKVARRRITARVEAAEPAVVVSSQPAIPGWRLALDGEPIRPLRVNGAFLGARVPAGEHRLELRYAPGSWRLGLVLAALGLVACPGLWWLGGR